VPTYVIELAGHIQNILNPLIYVYLYFTVLFLFLLLCRKLVIIRFLSLFAFRHSFGSIMFLFSGRKNVFLLCFIPGNAARVSHTVNLTSCNNDTLQHKYNKVYSQCPKVISCCQHIQSNTHIHRHVAKYQSVVVLIISGRKHRASHS
jgi:hypothetical protein